MAKQYRNKRWLLALSAAACVQAASAGYDQPPKEILAVMRAPPPPSPMLSPTRDAMSLVTWQDYPPMSRVATPFLRLAGVRVEPGNHSKHDTPGGYGITACATDFELVRVPDGARVPVTLPAGCPGAPQWSADGKRFAFENLAADSVELWLGEASTGAVHRVPGVRLNPMFGSELQWMPDQASLLVKLVPAGLGAPPPEPVEPPGPSTPESSGDSGQSSTYENRDTLANRHDEDLFDYYASTQLAFVDAASGKVTNAGKPGIYEALQPAPGGKQLLATAIHKPYSYVTTYDRFPKRIESWDLAARAQPGIRTLFDLPLTDRVPIHGVPTGPRDFSWRPTAPATLLWSEALDGGDWNVQVPKRDKVMMQSAPFTAPAVEIARTTQRYDGYYWTERAGLALLGEYDENKHWYQVFVVNVDDPAQAPKLLWDLSTDEHYADPGNPVFRTLANGARVVQLQGDSIFLSGAGSSPDGDRPFLDRLDLQSRKSERLFRSGKDEFEGFMAFIPGSTQVFLTRRQSVMDPPNVFLRTLGAASAAPAGEAAYASEAVAVTHLTDPTPQVRAIKKRLVKYKRAYGLDLSFTLYTPPGYKEGTRVPTILYAYPLDYADPSTAGQVTGSQMTFTRLYQYKRVKVICEPVT